MTGTRADAGSSGGTDARPTPPATPQPAPRSGPQPPPRPTIVAVAVVRRRWRWVRNHHPLRWALLVVSLVVAYVVLAPKTHEAADAFHQLRHVQLRWIWVALAGELASLLAFSVVTWSLLDRIGRPRFHRLVLVDLTTIALSHAVPGGSAAGTALGYELLEAEGVGGVEAGFAKVSQSLISGVLLQFMLGLALALQVVYYGPTTSNIGLAAAGAAMVVLVVGFSYLLAFQPQVIDWVARRLLGWIPRVPVDAISRAVDELSARMRDLLHRPRRLMWIAFWSLGNWVFDLVSLWASIKAFGADPNVIGLTVAFAVSQVAASIPISPGGLGVVESALVPLLGAFGVASDVAVLGVLTWRLFNFWLPFPLGIGAYVTILLTRRQATAARERRAAEQRTTAS